MMLFDWSNLSYFGLRFLNDVKYLSSHQLNVNAQVSFDMENHSPIHNIC
jgi:hypothetical protein